jgi:hypothetical protein
MRFLPVHFFVCRVRERVEATEEPEFLEVADEGGYFAGSIDL